MHELDQLGELTLGSRLKRVTDALYTQADAAYANHGLGFQAAWFPVLYMLSRHGAMPVTELAGRISQTHAAVSQFSRKLEDAGYIASSRSPADGRQRVLSITDPGRALVDRLRPVWSAFKRILRGYIAATGHDVLAALAGFEKELANHDFVAEVAEEVSRQRSRVVEIVDFAPEYRGAFRALNLEWLEKYFYVEEVDESVLSNPEQVILEPGGAILFARAGDDIVGTGALIHHGSGTYEVSKMAVAEAFQGLRLGRRLLDALVQRFRELRGEFLYLESNSRLEPALRLYESAGFEHAERRQPVSKYRRSNVYMVYSPERESGPS